jgi:hypothetical protein
MDAIKPYALPERDPLKELAKPHSMGVRSTNTFLTSRLPLSPSNTKTVLLLEQIREQQLDHILQIVLVIN